MSHAIAEQSPDVVVLTEYVQGDDPDHFVSELYGIGLQHYWGSKRQIDHTFISPGLKLEQAVYIADVREVHT